LKAAIERVYLSRARRYLPAFTCKSQFPHKSVNFFFILGMMKDKLTDLWGN